MKKSELSWGERSGAARTWTRKEDIRGSIRSNVKAILAVRSPLTDMLQGTRDRWVGLVLLQEGTQGQAGNEHGRAEGTQHVLLCLLVIRREHGDLRKWYNDCPDLFIERPQKCPPERYKKSFAVFTAEHIVDRREI